MMQVDKHTGYIPPETPVIHCEKIAAPTVHKTHTCSTQWCLTLLNCYCLPKEVRTSVLHLVYIIA